ncbi:MAG: hypothetical protein IPJ34_02995 [Myxococcales bacterium]|nr:hypothetical protein [Myxococcales bacterium]
MVPTTADLLPRLAEGRADDLVTALCLVAQGPIVIAPAMHPRMWAHPPVPAQRRDDRGRCARAHRGASVRRGGLRRGGRRSHERARGRRRGDRGRALAAPGSRGSTRGRRQGRRVEDLDPVRFLGNRSSGQDRLRRGGFPRRAAARPRHAGHGARRAVDTERVHARGRCAARSTCRRRSTRLDDAGDALVMAAAVADHRPAEYFRARRPRRSRGDALTLTLVKNPDLLAAIGAAARQEAPPGAGRLRRRDSTASKPTRGRKRAEAVDFVKVANLAAHRFGGDDDHVLFVDDGPARAVQGSKRAIADAVLDEVVAGLA